MKKKLPRGVSALSPEAAAVALAIRRAQRKYEYTTEIIILAAIEATNFIRAQKAEGREPEWVGRISQ